MAWTRRRCHRETWHVKTSRRFFVLSQQLSRAVCSVFAQNLFILMACPFSFLLMDFSLLVLFSYSWSSPQCLKITLKSLILQLKLSSYLFWSSPQLPNCAHIWFDSSLILPNCAHICFDNQPIFSKLCSHFFWSSAQLPNYSHICFHNSLILPNSAHICLDNQLIVAKLCSHLFW